MIRGYYTALSGIVAAMTGENIVADNIANVNTVGFKESRTVNEEFGFDIWSPEFGQDIGFLGTGTYPTGMQIDASQGPIEQTGVQTDLAVEGDGLFEVLTPNGVAYTRAGNFLLDATGTLVTEQGYPVLDTAGHSIQPPSPAFTVGPDGTIAGTGQRIALVAWPVDGVTRLGENLLTAPGSPPPATGSISQGALERSNVDMAEAMTELITYHRSLQLASRALSLQEGTLTDATTLGRLR
jgi:flagellar basal body rod protein FlgG